MIFQGLIQLALSLMGNNPSQKKNVIVGPTLKEIRELLKLMPEVDRAQYDQKAIGDTAPLCAFLTSCGYEKVLLLYHGYSTGITLNESSGHAPTFAAILEVLKTMPVTSAIREVEFYSCLCGSNAVPLFKIAQHLRTHVFAATFLHVRVERSVSGINSALLRNLNVFRNYFELGPAPDFETYLRRHANKLACRFYHPLGFDAQKEKLTNLDFGKMSFDETVDALNTVQNARLRSFADAERLTISDLATATAKQTDFLNPQFTLFAWVEFVGI